MTAQPLFDTISNACVLADLGGGMTLLAIDRIPEARTCMSGAAFALDRGTREFRPLGQRTVTFAVDPHQSQALCKRLVPVGTTLVQEAEIGLFPDRDRKARPWIYS